ncbi:MAG: NADH-quinone oxidoreductase subunit L [Planctomycetales bacterium]|nr:NADH-quinone oxidoreductase subunit L [Planctomycetales bacterium]
MSRPPVTPETLLPWVLAPPAAGAILLGAAALAAARRGVPGPGRLAGPLATLATFASFALACAAVAGLRDGTGPVVATLGPWIEAGEFRASASLVLDPLSATLLLVVTGVGSLIHLYAIGYMAEDPHRVRYFCFLNLFVTSMSLLVLAGDLLLLFAGWEGVGLCSYLLIGHWYREDRNARAGAKAFLVNRVGDAGFLVGLLLLAWAAAQSRPSVPPIPEGGGGTLSIAGLARLAAEPSGPLAPVATAAALLLLLGAAGKSAQVPLSVWLPDAMAGPTPVSALIHAATMVTAGIYLLARLGFLLALSPLASAVAAATGALTALVAALGALGQRDVKRVLAYSTVSQLGFMFAAAGAGASAAAVFHLTTHAFFKATLFLGAGAVIHALHGEQDLGRIAGRARPLRAAWVAMAVGCAALAGVPGLSGFASKEAVLGGILAAGLPSPLGEAVFAALLVAAAGTAAYATRLWILLFIPPGPADHAPGELHRVGPVMTVPLLALALLAALGGLLGSRLLAWLGAPAGPAGPAPLSGAALVALSVSALAVGAALGAATARRGPAALLARPRLDEAAGAVGEGVVSLSRDAVLPGVERGLVDGGVSAVALLVRGLGAAGRLAQTGLVRTYALAFAAGAAALLYLAGRGGP